MDFVYLLVYIFILTKQHEGEIDLCQHDNIIFSGKQVNIHFHSIFRLKNLKLVDFGNFQQQIRDTEGLVSVLLQSASLAAHIWFSSECKFSLKGCNSSAAQPLLLLKELILLYYRMYF